MTDKLHLRIYQQADLEQFTSTRPRETKAGEKLQTLPSNNINDFGKLLGQAVENRAHYAVVMVPEDIGARANFGRSGAHEAPRAFLRYFCNLQQNKFLDFQKILIVGEIELEDLMERSKNASNEELRDLCKEVDGRVEPVLEEIFRHGLEPIVIGGGNNNSLPILKALRSSTATTRGVACVNCDPHADFRPLEGRHSGNPFSYAFDEGVLTAYCIVGLHEGYNSDMMIQSLDKARFPYFTYEDFAVRGNTTFEQQVQQAREFLRAAQCPAGCELDLDSIAGFPVSAKTPAGITVEQALRYIHLISATNVIRYLHLSEGAPQWSNDDGEREVGKVISLCVSTYVKAREASRRRNQNTREVVRSKIGT